MIDLTQWVALSIHSMMPLMQRTANELGSSAFRRERLSISIPQFFSGRSDHDDLISNNNLDSEMRHAHIHINNNRFRHSRPSNHNHFGAVEVGLFFDNDAFWDPNFAVSERQIPPAPISPNEATYAMLKTKFRERGLECPDTPEDLVCEFSGQLVTTPVSGKGLPDVIEHAILMHAVECDPNKHNPYTNTALGKLTINIKLKNKATRFIKLLSDYIHLYDRQICINLINYNSKLFNSSEKEMRQFNINGLQMLGRFGLLLLKPASEKPSILTIGLFVNLINLAIQLKPRRVNEIKFIGSSNLKFGTTFAKPTVDIFRKAFHRRLAIHPRS